MLDVSKGNIRIKTTGAAGGGLSSNETALNPKGYYITGTTTRYNIIVEKNVTTKITLDNVNITCDTSNYDCINVSHANVTITLTGKNNLLCNAGNSKDGLFSNLGNAITKDGKDGSLTIQCESADEAGHHCDSSCGSLNATGNKSLYHAGAIGNSTRNCRTEGETGFTNFTVRGGNIVAEAGYHSPGIGGACTSNYANGKVENITITGGNIKAVGNVYCAGIGGGNSADINGIYIRGGFVEAVGGNSAPGLGSVNACFQNLVITGGDTIVVAIGDSGSSAPGIGYATFGSGSGSAADIIASPNTGYQGYIQDGKSLTDYTFMEGTPFAKDTEINVGKFYTKVYFGPYRDENAIEKDTKEQIGANHVVSKTGGEGFTQKQLKDLTKVTGKQQDGTDFPPGDLVFKDASQIEKINQAKTSGKIGDYPLTYTTPNGTEVTVTISLRDSGTDVSTFDPQNPVPVIGANDFEKDTGGDAFTEEQLRAYGEVKGKDKDGNTISLDDFTVDPEQFQKINQAKTSGKAGVFDLIYKAPDGNQVKVKVTLVGYDEIEENPDNGESIKGMNVISKTGGEGFSEKQLKDLTRVKAFDENGHEIPAEDLVLSDPEELKEINKAKKSGETGDFSLSFETAQGTKVTVTVYLRDDGTDGAKADPEHPESMIAANDAEHKTGGNAFTKEDLIKLCKAKGKDGFKNNIELDISQDEMDQLNAAKKAGKTGTFSLTFSVAGGKEAKVTVTLTGEHKVSFNPNGGDYTPKTQTVPGGKCAVEPKEPKRDSYIFEGWYYKDENGKEQKWNFETAVHSDISLKAKWSKVSESNTFADNKDKDEGEKNSKDKKKEKKNRYYWDSQDITKNYGKSDTAAKTGDTKDMVVVVIMTASGLGTLYLFYRRSRKA
ncbi:InlB B-repeat-containing protein [Anaerostipes sp.]|uniref:InlB B-repeat-containing protein n=1 Tax=Anaerostipes sp. TaxID=1872530 RepID=UPI0025BA21D6|nr:InlB B-repeat-containing protein [Anaerostipes sp.]MBS7007983.1 InlB B-repeat-containing protein [Anaerostipes sp.]